MYVDFRNKTTFDVLIVLRNGTDGGIETYPSYVYTPEDQAKILDRLEKDFEGFNIEFVLNKPPASMRHCTSILAINGNSQPGIIKYERGRGRFGFSVLFGQAQHIDFLNLVEDDFAFIDANLWTFLAANVSPSSFALLSGIPETTPMPEAVRIATINQVHMSYSLALDHIERMNA